MKKNIRIGSWFSLLMLFAFCVQSFAASLKLGSTFSDNMVLQRGQDVRVWGEAAPGAKVQIQLGNESATVAVDPAGHWESAVKPLPAGGPYTATFTSGLETVSLKNILSGDVWLCSGQSNMQFGVSEDVDAEQMLTEAGKQSNLRLLMIPKAGGEKPAYRLAAQWSLTSSPQLARFSAVAIHLGLALGSDPKLQGVPIGLIDSTFGGTAAEGWSPAGLTEKMAKEDLSASMFNFAPGSLYNAMIAPLGPLPLTGVVWYQGESNAGKPIVYPQIMSSLIGAWRKQFRRDDLTFIIVQLPRFIDSIGGYSFAWLREAQSVIVNQTPHTGLVVSIDTTDGFSLHPTTKAEIGRRAAMQARRLAYHEDVVADGPTFKFAAREGKLLRVTFDLHDGPLRAAGGAKKIVGFALAGDDRIFHFADAGIASDDTIVLKCDEVSEPKFVRYAWGAVPECNLCNQAGLPAGPFRTDDLPPGPALEIKPMSPGRHVATDLYDIILGGSGDLISLGVDKEQLVSNNLDGFGTGNFPGYFGPRQLQTVTPITPDTIRYSDLGLAMTYSFSKSGFTIKIQNLSKDAKEKVIYRLHLASGVQISGDGNATRFTRGKSQIRLTGADHAEADGGGGVNVDVTIEGKSDKTLVFTCSRLP